MFAICPWQASDWVLYPQPWGKIMTVYHALKAMAISVLIHGFYVA